MSYRGTKTGGPFYQPIVQWSELSKISETAFKKYTLGYGSSRPDAQVSQGPLLLPPAEVRGRYNRIDGYSGPKVPHAMAVELPTTYKGSFESLRALYWSGHHPTSN
jgi:hypothetical protein